jgi:hydrogenase expression/formation protein HypC
MCLGVPGRVQEIHTDPTGMTMGRVTFGGIVRECCLAYVPEVSVGDYVVVHVGFAISRVDEEEAARTLAYLAELGELSELGQSSGADDDTRRGDVAGENR